MTRVVPSRDPAADLAKIDLRREALCEHALALPPTMSREQGAGSGLAPIAKLQAPSSLPGTATLTDRRPGQMAVTVCCSSRQLLVVAESYHPGWRCTIDGSPKPVYRVNGDFLAASSSRAIPQSAGSSVPTVWRAARSSPSPAWG